MTKKQAQKQPTLPAAPDPAQSAREPKTRQNKRLVKQRAQSLDPSQSSKAVPKAVNPAKTDTVDIDEIFKTAKKRLQPATVDKEEQPKKARKVEGSKDDIFGLGQPASRRYDPEGLPVYSPEELNVGAGGETDQCPFDCTCCF